MRSALAATVFALVVAQGCSACIKTKCNTDADCGGGLTCETDTGLCKDNTASSSGSSGTVTSVAGSSGNSGGSSSRVSSGGSSSRVSSGGSSSRPSSSGGVSSSGVVSSSSHVPACPMDCGAAQNGADAGNITGFSCSSGGTGLGACVPTCASGYANCGGGCTTNITNDPANCGACGRGLGMDGGANACGDGGPVCARSNGTVSVCGAANPYCKADKGCVECTSDTHCEATEVCCGNTCVPMGNACGCSLENVNITGMACTAAVGGECIVMASGRPAVAQADFHNAACGCDFMSVLPVAMNVCNAVSGFLGLCAPPGGGPNPNVGVCAAQNSPARRDGGFAAENCGARGNTCDPLKGGLTCVQDGGGVGHCVCDNAVDSPSCTQPVSDSMGFAHVVADVCVPSSGQCGCSANANQPCMRNDGGADCCVSGCVNLRGDPNNCGGCGIQCRQGSVNSGCNEARPGTSLDVYSCGCDAGSECSVNSNDCIGHLCVCRQWIDGDAGVLTGCPVNSYCCDAVNRPGSGIDNGCCDLPCGSSANNRCTRFAGGPRQ